ncbi:MAG TPA: hypothetical protein VGB93_06195 [Methylovirgula sp.]
MIKSFSVSATCAAILVASLSASSAFASTHHASHRESVLGMNRYYALVGQSSSSASADAAKFRMPAPTHDDPFSFPVSDQ